MGKGKLILICQSGGEFVTKGDGTMSYEKGEANAVNITLETVFDDLKLKLAEMCNLDQKTISVKYFLPGNRRNLITLRNDKDLKRMIDFHGNSVTADVFLSGKEGFDHDAVKVQDSGNSGVKLAETVIHDVEPVNPCPSPSPSPSKVPADAHVGSTAAADETARSSSPSQTSGDSPVSEDASASDTDYRPRIARKAIALQVVDFDMDTSPADTVKKRRRTASWRLDAHGPKIVTSVDNGSEKRKQKKKSKPEAKDVSSLETDDLGSPAGGTVITAYDEDLPENLIASWKDCITGVGQDFNCVKEFRTALQKYSVAHRFVYKLKKNDTNRASGVCVEEGCPWSIHAAWLPASSSFRIKKFNNSHTCNGESWKNAHPARNLLVGVIREKLRESPHQKPKEIAKSIVDEFGIQLTYTQVWRGMEDAREQLQGSYKESYNRLPWFCEKLVETNPGSYVKMMTNDEKRLQYLFVSLACCVQGFQNACRPILFLNSTHLKSKYHESLFTATAVDADDGFFPVAFCIVDNDWEDSWRCFLQQLKSVLPNSLTITFVSDREKGLEKVIDEVFENAYHGYSMYHLLESYKKNLKGPFHGEGRGVLPAKFFSAAYAVRPVGFKKCIEQIKQICTSAYDWIVQVEPQHWASSSFKGERYNHILENVSEPYSKLLDEIRESTIIQKIEALMHMISEQIRTRQEESSKWTTLLTPSKENRLLEEALRAKDLRVFISSDILFEVHDNSTHVVNIEKWDCTCLEWKETGLPCRHAIAALNSSRKNVYNYCSRNFTVESYRLTYSQLANPVPGLGDLLTNGDPVEAEVLPPEPKSPGQQKKEPPSKPEEVDKRTVTCSKCKEPGHNKASCKNNLLGQEQDKASCNDNLLKQEQEQEPEDNKELVQVEVEVQEQNVV